MKGQHEKEGMIYAALSYMMWGFVPVYWKLLQEVSSGEILAHRILWSFIFMVILLAVTMRWGAFLKQLKEILRNGKLFLALFIASALVSLNWGVFIWAVNAGKILETSLGYYINPLVSVLLGVLVLKEKLSVLQKIAFLLAGVGVFIMGIYHGSFPWVALILALSFGLYGLAKKLMKVDSSIGLTLETMMMVPFALIFIIFMMFTSNIAFFDSGLTTSLLLIGGGIVTALPLLYFARGAEKVSLSLLGILQYITPTLSLFIGVFMYHEPFTKYHFFAFLFIWMALALYTFTIMNWGKTNARKLEQGA